MTYGSVYEITNPLTKVAKQHFVDWFSGEDLDLKRWTYTDYLSSNHTGSGMADETDGGFKLVGNSSGGSAQQALIAFNDKRPFSNTGSVVIWVAKMVASGTNKQGGWGMCGVMPNYWMDGLKINAPTGTGNYGFYTMNATEAQTQIANVSETTSWKTYKLEQLNGSANCVIDGVLEATRTANMSRYKMQPFMVSKYDNSEIRARYCEAYNT